MRSVKIENRFIRLVLLVLLVTLLVVISGVPNNCLYANDNASIFNEKWVTDTQRVLSFVQNGNKVTASMENVQGWQFSGTISGNTISGQWSDPPYNLPNHKGLGTFTISDDAKYIVYTWRYGIDNIPNPRWYKLNCKSLTTYKDNAKPVLISSVSPGQVKLTWYVEDNTYIEGYNVYRSLTPNLTENTPLNDTVIDVSSQNKRFVDYVDIIPEKDIYYYTLKAQFKDKTLSKPSNQVATYINDIKKIIVLYINNPEMKVDNTLKEIDPGRGTTPVIRDSRTLVPIRAIIETLGGKVRWDPIARKVTIIIGSKTLELWIDQTKTTVNGKAKEIDVAPQIINDRSMLPLRFISENIGCTVEWEQAQQKITIVRE